MCVGLHAYVYNDTLWLFSFHYRTTVHMLLTKTDKYGDLLIRKITDKKNIVESNNLIPRQKVS